MGVLQLVENNFKEEVMNSKKPVLIDFWATWCGPCMMLSPVIEELSKELTDIKVCKVNVDEEESLANSFHITNIPTLVFIKDGKVVTSSVGFKSKEEILNMIK